jgi:hypothetical protein
MHAEWFARWANWPQLPKLVVFKVMSPQLGILPTDDPHPYSQCEQLMLVEFAHYSGFVAIHQLGFRANE